MQQEANLLTTMKKTEFRWRLAGGKLPLYERHLRSLAYYGLSSPLRAWIRSRLEWTLENMTTENPDGVLLIEVEDDDTVTMSVVAARPLFDGATSGCTRWIVSAGVVYPTALLVDASDTLVRDLAKTIGFSVSECFCGDNPASIDTAKPDASTTADTRDVDALGVDESFYVSDEFGIISCDEQPGVVTGRMLECFEKLYFVEPAVPVSMPVFESQES